jgi:hypothetical protein
MKFRWLGIELSNERFNQFMLEFIPEHHSSRFLHTTKSFPFMDRKKIDAMAWCLRLGHLCLQILKHLVNSSQRVQINDVIATECDAEETPGGPNKRLSIDFHCLERKSKNITSQYLLLTVDLDSNHK